jgi:hypothetical protein
MQYLDFVNTTMDPSFYNCQLLNTKICSYLYYKQFQLFTPLSFTVPAETFVIVSVRSTMFFGVSNSVEKQLFPCFVSPGVI